MKVLISMSASDEIYGKVARVLVESLNVDEAELTPTATLQGDLGAESIDFSTGIGALPPFRTFSPSVWWCGTSNGSLPKASRLA